MNSPKLNLHLLFKDKQIRLQAVLALFILAIGFSLSLAGFVELQSVANERLYLQKQQYTAERIKQIQTNLDISLDSLDDVAALYLAAGQVSQAQLASYLSSDTKYHSGTVALGWAPRVLGKDISQFEDRVRQEDSGFHVYEITGHGMPSAASGDKTVYPIQFIISPSAGSMKAGLNIASIASRQRVMKKAERIQSTAITQRLSLYAGKRQFYGFQALHPIFNSNDLGQELMGFVVGVYDIESLIEDVFAADDNKVDIALYDANTLSQQLLYSSSDSLTSVEDIVGLDQSYWTYTLKVADQQWIVAAFPNNKKVIGSSSWLPYTGLVVGGVITLLLTLYLFISLIKTRQLSQLSTDLAGTATQLDMQTKLKREADKANQAKSGLLRAASHDLRQPLHTIGLLATLLKTSSNQQERDKLIDNIQSAVEAMDSLFTGLLDLSLLESNQLAVHKKNFYLQDILDSLILDFSLQAKEKAVDFSWVDSSSCVFTDKSLLERILRNLLSNAFRYTPSGRVLLGSRRLAHHIRICIFDTGIGLTKHAQGKIFDAFYREQQAQQLADQGLGLGLSIVDESAKLLGLNVGVKSEHKQGSLFYIDVPYGEASLIGEVITTTSHTVINKTIWLIEDNEVIRDGLRRILEQWQCQVESMASGQNLKKLMTSTDLRPDIIIADYQLVNETGVELVNQIRAYYQQQIPLIMMTGTTDINIREKISQISDCEFMLKPVKTEELNQVLSRINR